MRTIVTATGALVLVVILAVFVVVGQEAPGHPLPPPWDKFYELPPALQPSEYALAQAKAMHGQVFKIFPSEMQHPAMVGINNGPMTHGELGNGNYYVFTKGPHYPPLIHLEFIRGGFTIGSGLDYGIFTDLGEVDPRSIDKTVPAGEYLLSYKPPKLESDIWNERKRAKNFSVGDVIYTNEVRVRTGHTYLLRAICFYWADLVIVLHILETSPDGSITVLWKKVAEFEVPPQLYVSDADLQTVVDAVMAELHVNDLQIKVKDNVLIFTGVDLNFQRVIEALSQRKVRYRGIGYQMRRSAN